MAKKIFTIKEDEIIIEPENFTTKCNFVKELIEILDHFYQDSKQKDSLKETATFKDFKTKILEACAFDISSEYDSVYDIFTNIYNDIVGMFEQIRNSNESSLYYKFPIYKKFHYLIMVIGIIAKRKGMTSTDDIESYAMLLYPDLIGYISII